MKNLIFSDKVTTLIVALLFTSCISMVFYRFNAIMSINTILLSLLILYKGLRSFVFSDKIYFPFFFVFIILLFNNLYYFGDNSLRNIGEILVLFIIPVFSQKYFDFQEKYFDRLLHFFTICISLICIYIIDFYISYIPHHEYDWYLARFFIEYNLKFHSTFVGIWISISILMLVHLLQKIKQKLYQVIIILMAFLQIGTLLILNTRMALYALVLILIILAFLFFNRKQKMYVLLTSILFVALIALLTNRYKDDALFLRDNSITKSERYPIYKCALESTKGHLLFGNNLITLQSEQNKCYQCLKRADLAEKNTNCHNQYLDYLLKGGLPLLISFILLLMLKLRFSFKAKNYLYFSITLFFCFSFLTENVLSRQYGIFIYFFIDLLFLKTVFVYEPHCTNKIENG